MQVEHHPDAIEDMVEAAWFYEQRSEALGEALLDEVESAVQTIRDDPLRFPVEHRDKRRCPVARFPYSVYYRLVGKRIRILAIKHHRQSDEILAERE